MTGTQAPHPSHEMGPWSTYGTAHEARLWGGKRERRKCLRCRAREDSWAGLSEELVHTCPRRYRL